MNSQLQGAITLVNAGKKKEAQNLLLRVIEAEPQNTVAWLWLETTLDDPEKRRECLEIVLKIHPDNVVARKRLKLLSPTNPKKQPLILTIGAYLILVTFGFLWLRGVFSFLQGSPPSSPTQHYVVPESPSQFRLLWSVENAYGRWEWDNIGLIVRDSRIFFLGGVDPKLYSTSITQFDLDTGEIQQVISSFTGIHSLAINKTQLLGGIDGSRNRQAQIVAYDIESGKQIYLRNFGLAQPIKPVNVTNNSSSQSEISVT